MWIGSRLSRGLQTWNEAIRRRRNPPVRLIAHADRYCVFTGDALLQNVPVSEIKRITMYKRDLLTTDSVCAFVELCGTDELSIPTIWEEHEGFYDVIALFSTLTGFDADWQDKVILPPFATNWTVVFDRSSSPGSTGAATL
jgi:hypothetical protein